VERHDSELKLSQPHREVLVRAGQVMLGGLVPHRTSLSDRDLLMFLADNWDNTLFRNHLAVGRPALCILGREIHRHPDVFATMGFDRVAELLRELSPTLGSSPVTPQLLEDVLEVYEDEFAVPC
jgi:hypothetical protein